MSEEEIQKALFGVNVKEYLFVDCPKCGVTGEYQNLSADERNRFLHGGEGILTQVLDVAANLGQSVLRHGALKVASRLLSAQELGNHARFCRCMSCKTVLLVCPHCEKLLEGRRYHESGDTFSLRCMHCSNEMDL
jgi:hypothetical protein